MFFLILILLISSEDCNWDYGVPGEVNQLISQRRRAVAGGHVADDHEYPWQAQMRNALGESLCGGSLISSEWILTAAHCFDALSMNDLSQENIDLNVINHITLKNKQIKLNIIKIFIHPKYDPFDLLVKHDIALVKIERIKTDLCNHDEGLNAIKLLDDGFDVNGCTAWSTGIGELFFNGPLSPEEDLMEISTKVFNHDTCNHFLNEKIYEINEFEKNSQTGGNKENIRHPLRRRRIASQRMNHRKLLSNRIDEQQNVEAYVNSGYETLDFNLNEAQLCAYSPNDFGEDTCHGDSGGALLIDSNVNETEHVYVVAGIISYGYQCGRKPGVFTRVSFYKDWILSVFPEAPFQQVEACDREEYREGPNDGPYTAQPVETDTELSFCAMFLAGLPGYSASPLCEDTNCAVCGPTGYTGFDGCYFCKHGFEVDPKYHDCSGICVPKGSKEINRDTCGVYLPCLFEDNLEEGQPFSLEWSDDSDTGVAGLMVSAVFFVLALFI